MTSFRTLLVRRLLLVLTLPMAALAVYLLWDIENQGKASLDRSLRVAATMVEALAARTKPADLEGELVRLGNRVGLRLTVIRADGGVLGDSAHDPTAMENHLQRPEVRDALSRGAGVAERRSATTQVATRYLAIRGGTDKDPLIFRAAISRDQLNEQLSRTRWTVLTAVVVVFALLLLLSFRVGQEVLNPVEALSGAAERFTAGDTSARVLPDGPEPLRRLGDAYNALVDRLNEQVASLDRAQAHLDAVIRQMPDGLLVLAADGVIVRANAAAESLLGLPAEKILGRTPLAVLMSYAVDREVIRVLEGERGTAVDLRLPDGRALRVAVGALRVRDGESGAVILLLDTTELRRTDDMRRDFVANVSHELRTPVAAIRAMVETLLLRGNKRPELVEQYVPRVVLECERIDRLVSDLLLLAQTEAGQLRLQLETLDPHEVAAEVALAVEPLARSAATQVILGDFAPALVRADRFALGQCLRNLVDNAIRYAAGGTVRLGSREDGNQVILFVSDTGPGIPPEDVSRIFERFYRVDKARVRESESPIGGGSGLGLSIVRHLTEAQGGRAWVESQVGEGSAFYLALPRASGPTKAIEAPESSFAGRP